MDITHLNSTDLKILYLLVKKDSPVTIGDICSNLNKERQTIYNKMISLKKKELIETTRCYNTVMIDLPEGSRDEIINLVNLQMKKES